jgi:Subtilase family
MPTHDETPRPPAGANAAGTNPAGRGANAPAAGGPEGPGEGPYAERPEEAEQRLRWARSLPSTRQGDEAAYILHTVRGVEPGPSDWPRNGIDFFFRRRHILVRDDYLDRVLGLDALGASIAENGGLIAGVTLLQTRLETLDALSIVRRSYGAGVASPDHFVTLSPAGWCAPIEPTAVPAWADPDPAVSPGHGLGKGVRVLVVDGGLGTDAAATHTWLHGVTGDPDLGKVIGATVDLQPYSGHGTFVAGVLRCMAPRADVIVRRAFVKAGGSFESDLVRMLDRVLSRDAPDLICMPAGTYTLDALPPLTFRAFLDRLRDHKGVALVTPAGNDATSDYFFPAAMREVVSAGALDTGWRTRAAYTNRGGWVDVYAPGTDLVNAFLSGTFECIEGAAKGQQRTFTGMARWTGTSFASAVVAGLIAARMSVTGENANSAAAALLALAGSNAIPGVGPILLPGQV